MDKEFELIFLKEMVEEHENNVEHLDKHTKESIINLYKNLLGLAKEIFEVVE